MSTAFLRSDEAGCYHNNELIAAVCDIGNRVGVKVVRYDFSEPQYGKDVCDRMKGIISFKRRTCEKLYRNDRSREQRHR